IFLRRRKRKRLQKRRKTKRFWGRDIFKERKSQDCEYYFRYLRMSPERFEHLLTLVGPLISKKATKMRELISAAERLTLTLRMLASGDDQQSLPFSYSQGRTIVSHIPRETCSTIWMALRDIYLRPPSS
ncbi:unnamed protein product, partial [Pocillopora meandrina]